MDATSDGNWLLGNPDWWDLDGQFPPDFRNGELAPNDIWLSTTPRVGNYGWMRQRLKPLAFSLLRPLAWAPFFLFLSVLPLAFPGQTPDDQISAAALFLFSWFLVIYPLSTSRSLQIPSANNIFSLPVDWKLLSLALLIFPIHIFIDPKIGWISYVILWIAMFRTIGQIQNMMNIPPARFIIPLYSNSWDSNELTDIWVINSEKWHKGLIASSKCNEGELRISGFTRSEYDFLSLTFVHKSGFIQDPFFSMHKGDEKLHLLLDSPPPVSGISWPKQFLVPTEEE